MLIVFFVNNLDLHEAFVKRSSEFKNKLKFKILPLPKIKYFDISDCMINLFSKKC